MDPSAPIWAMASVMLTITLSLEVYWHNLHKRKSRRIKSHDLGCQFTSLLREITIGSNRWCRMSIEESSLRHVSPSYWTLMWSSLDHKKLVNIAFKKVWTNNTPGPKSVLNSNFSWMACHPFIHRKIIGAKLVTLKPYQQTNCALCVHELRAPGLGESRK